MVFFQRRLAARKLQTSWRARLFCREDSIHTQTPQIRLAYRPSGWPDALRLKALTRRNALDRVAGRMIAWASSLSQSRPCLAARRLKSRYAIPAYSMDRMGRAHARTATAMAPTARRDMWR